MRLLVVTGLAVVLAVAVVAAVVPALAGVVAVAVLAAVLPGRGVVLKAGLRPLVVLWRRRELALRLAAPARVRRKAPGPVVEVVVMLLRRAVAAAGVVGLLEAAGVMISRGGASSSGSLGLKGRRSGGAVAPLFSRTFSK